MSEQQSILLALGRGYNGFYCPTSRFHLVGVLRPQGHWPAHVPFTEDVKRALLGGTIVDVNKVVDPAALDFKYTDVTPISSSDRKRAQRAESDNSHIENGESLTNENNELLSALDIDTMTKKQLAAYMDEKGIELGLGSRATLEEIQVALKEKLGLTEEKRPNFNETAKKAAE